MAMDPIQTARMWNTFIGNAAKSTKSIADDTKKFANDLKNAGVAASEIDKLTKNYEKHLKAEAELGGQIRRFRDKLKESHIEVNKQLIDEAEIAARMFRRYGQTSDRHKERVKLLLVERNLYTEIGKFIGERETIETMVVKGAKAMLEANLAFQQGVADTNVSLEARFDLFDKTLRVQQRTAASTQEMFAAVKALRGQGLNVRKNFEEILESTIKMQQGLGISVENAAQLQRTFEVGLNTSVKSTLDAITDITTHTGLAADEAARYANEIGRAMRIFRGASIDIKPILQLTAAMKDVGGDAEEIVKMFNEMATAGTPEAQRLRGIARVTSLQQLREPGGADKAFENIGGFIRSIVTADKDTVAYTFQLEQASRILHTTTTNVSLLNDMLDKSKEPLDENTKLQQHWRDQMDISGAYLSKLTEALKALAKEAVLPLLQNVVTPTIQRLTDFVNWLREHDSAVPIATSAIIVATAITVGSLGAITKSLYKLAASAVAAELATRSGGGIAVILKSLSGLLTKLATAGGIIGIFGRIFALLTNPWVLVGTAIVGIIAAFWLYYRRQAQDKEEREKAFLNKRNLLLRQGEMTPRELINIYKHILVNEDMTKALDYVNKHLADVKFGRDAVYGQPLLELFYDELAKAETEARERAFAPLPLIDQDRVMARDKEMRERDEEMLGVWKYDIPKLWKDIEKQRDEKTEQSDQDAKNDALTRKSEQGLPFDPQAGAHKLAHSLHWFGR
jgi:hypothetical protein